MSHLVLQVPMWGYLLTFYSVAADHNQLNTIHLSLWTLNEKHTKDSHSSRFILSTGSFGFTKPSDAILICIPLCNSTAKSYFLKKDVGLKQSQPAYQRAVWCLADCNQSVTASLQTSMCFETQIMSLQDTREEDVLKSLCSALTTLVASNWIYLVWSLVFSPVPLFVLVDTVPVLFSYYCWWKIPKHCSGFSLLTLNIKLVCLRLVGAWIIGCCCFFFCNILLKRATVRLWMQSERVEKMFFIPARLAA